jgi:phosphoserine phosphatase
LYVFDMDGTLLPDTTASLELARATGTEAELASLEREFAAGALSTRSFATAIHQLWGELSPALVSSAFQRTRKLANIAAALRAISLQGSHSCLITLSPSFYADHFKGLGFDYVYASVFPSGGAPLDLHRILTPQHKPALVRRLCEEHGYALEDVVAFGDSSSDLPLFQALRHTVAVNANAALSAVASRHYRGHDLLEALRLFDQHQVAPR